MRIRRFVIAGVAAAAALSLGVGPAAAIADGVAASPGQFPFAVKLVMPVIHRADGSTYSSGCSGELISPTWIMTAGHCFHDVNGNRVSGPVPYATSATMNTSNVVDNPGEQRNVVQVQQASGEDIALAQLDGSVTDVQPMALNTRKPARGQTLTVAGWGATSSVNPQPSDQLYWGRVQISTVKSATVLVTGSYPALDTSACMYDSGAPYFTTPAGSAPVLVSVESNGPDCPHTSAETTARVDPIASWVAQVVPDLP